MNKVSKIIIVILFVVWMSGFGVFAYHINNYKTNIDTYTEAVIALTGGRNRIIEAINIYKQGKAKKVFISGVSRNVSWEMIKKRQRIELTNDSEITIGYRAKNTIENAKETIAWLQQNKINSIRLVTSNYHMPRSVTEFKAKDKNLKIIPHPVYSDRVEKKWWKSWRTFSLIFKEYNKFLYVYIRSNIQA